MIWSFGQWHAIHNSAYSLLWFWKSSENSVHLELHAFQLSDFGVLFAKSDSLPSEPSLSRCKAWLSHWTRRFKALVIWHKFHLGTVTTRIITFFLCIKLLHTPSWAILITPHFPLELGRGWGNIQYQYCIFNPEMSEKFQGCYYRISVWLSRSL